MHTLLVNGEVKEFGDAAVVTKTFVTEITERYPFADHERAATEFALGHSVVVGCVAGLVS
jgi:hypothetical protein